MKLSIDELLPYKDRRKLVAPISRAYSISERVLSIDNLKEQPIIKNIESILKQTIVEYEIKRVIDEGILNGITCQYNNNVKNTHPFIELVGERFKVTVSHVRKASTIPSNAQYRNDRAATNQLSLFDNSTEIEQIYGILTHGHNQSTPNFICLGIPDHRMKSWEDQVNIIREPRVILLDNSIETLREVEVINSIAQNTLKNTKPEGIMVSLTEFSKQLQKRSEENG